MHVLLFHELTSKFRDNKPFGKEEMFNFLMYNVYNNQQDRIYTNFLMVDNFVIDFQKISSPYHVSLYPDRPSYQVRFSFCFCFNNEGSVGNGTQRISHLNPRFVS